MRILVFLLVLANLLFYAFSQGYFGQAENPDAQRISQQIYPERVKIVARGELPQPVVLAPEPKIEPPPPLPEPPAMSEPVPDTTLVSEQQPVPDSPEQACTRWEGLLLAEADRLTARLSEQFPVFKLSRRVEAGESNGWWVYIPPLPGKPAADKKAGELRALGVTDYFVVQEAGPRYMAISLGIFSSEKGAQERLAQLKEIGVRSARLSVRPSKDSRITLDALGPRVDRVAVRSAASSLLPESKALDCP
ncbi:MAG: SPOR domain-containing protein [Rhodocyclaceae bacterium]|nr:SPOR domain-containing protein [Rhodocyclaceae bacterium]